MLTVLKAGALTTLQDGGRYGWQRFGVPVCGAMDLLALSVCNLLCGNEEAEAALEITGGGCKFRFESYNVFALSGADCGATLSGTALAPNRAYCARRGDELTLGFPKSGFRTYLAVAGGFAAAPVMGSRSVCRKAGFGGFHGGAVQSGETLGFRAPELTLRGMEDRVAPAALCDRSPRPVRLILGPQDDHFTARGVRTLFTSTYKLAPDSDRMGYRLTGPAIEYAPGRDGNILSDGVALGSVQIAGGKPIIMMADRQTTGGYAKIATVAGVDLPYLAQLLGGAEIRFAALSVEDAQALALAQRRALCRMKRAMDSLL